MSIHWGGTKGAVQGLKIETDVGEEVIVGNASSDTYKTFTFENDNILVGFFGTKQDWQVNSLGIIYLDPRCTVELLPIDDG